MKKLHDNKKHPYLRASFWVNNRFWEKEHSCNYSKDTIARFEKQYQKDLQVFNDKFKKDDIR